MLAGKDVSEKLNYKKRKKLNKELKILNNKPF
jgi:hypothetical protein